MIGNANEIDKNLLVSFRLVSLSVTFAVNQLSARFLNSHKNVHSKESEKNIITPKKHSLDSLIS